MIALAPDTVQNIPDCFRREPMTVLQPASNHAGADKEVLSPELGIAHTPGISLEAGRFDADCFQHGGAGDFDSPEKRNQLFELPSIEFWLLAHDPPLLVGSVAGVEHPRHIPKMLARMKQVNDLDCAGKVQISIIPDPFGTIADDHFLFRAAPAAVPDFEIEAVAELAGGLNRARAGSGTRIANRVSRLIPCGLSEDTAELYFARMSRLPLHFADPALGLFLYDWDSGPVHLHTENRNRFSHDDGELQLNSLLHSGLFAFSNVAADPFGSSFDGLSGHLESRQQFELTASVIERRVRTNQRQHTAHTGREIRLLDIQGGIYRKLAVMTVRAQIRDVSVSLHRAP